MKLIPKGWGFELLFINTDKYAAKFLYVREGGRMSLHYHTEKHETMFCLGGECHVYADGLADRFLHFGDQVVILPTTKHKLMCSPKECCLVLEVSTPGDPEDEDSIRLQDGDSQLLLREDWKYGDVAKNTSPHTLLRRCLRKVLSVTDKNSS